MNQKHIVVTEETRDELKTFGHKGETYQTIVARLIKAYKEKKVEGPNF